MNLGSLGKIADLKDKALGAANQKAFDMMSDVNVILAALPDAGFQIGGVDVELGAAMPKLTVEVNIGQAIRQDKIKNVLAGNPNNFLLTATFNALLQASNLQQALSADTIELKSVKIELAATPTVTVQWKEKAAAKVVAAST
jgi:hypothetical protein